MHVETLLIFKSWNAVVIPDKREGDETVPNCSAKYMSDAKEETLTEFADTS